MRLPYAFLAAATAAWSPLRLEGSYLACSSKKLPQLDVFTSFRSIRNERGDHSLFARDFYNAFLAYWPPSLGRLVILHEADGRTARPVQRLVQCLQRATCVSQPVSKPFDLPLYEHKVADQSREVNANFTSIDDVQMQAWKYVLDLHSEAELLGVLDDDACLLDHVIRGDLMTCSDKIIVRGVRFERRPIKTKHEVSNGFLGISSDVNFMVPLLCSSALQSGVSRGSTRSRVSLGDRWLISTQVDFPVVFWRGHLEAFRRHVVRHVLREDYSVETWWRAVAQLLRRGWRPSEYSNLMGFAMQRSRRPVV